MAPAFAFSMLATRGGRLAVAVVGLAVGLPVIFWLIATFVPAQKDTEPPPVRIEVKLRDARTGAAVNRALVRVYRRIGEHELPDAPPKQAVAGYAVVHVRPETARSESSFLRVDASGYLPYRNTLAALFEDGEEESGEYYVTAELTPEDG